MKVQVYFAGPDQFQQFQGLVTGLSNAREILKDLSGRRGISIEISDAHDVVMDAHNAFCTAQVISTHECEVTRVENLKKVGIETAVTQGDVCISGVDTDLLERQRLILATIPRAGLEVRQQAALNGVQHMLDYWSDQCREEEESG